MVKWSLVVMIQQFLLVTLFVISSVSFAENISTLKPSKDIDLSIPEKDFNYKRDISERDMPVIQHEKVAPTRCEELLSQIDALRGKLKSQRRQALIKEHELECLERTEWKTGDEPKNY